MTKHFIKCLLNNKFQLFIAIVYTGNNVLFHINRTDILSNPYTRAPDKPSDIVLPHNVINVESYFINNVLDSKYKFELNFWICCNYNKQIN